MKARTIRENANSTMEALEMIAASANVAPAVAAAARNRIQNPKI